MRCGGLLLGFILSQVTFFWPHMLIECLSLWVLFNRRVIYSITDWKMEGLVHAWWGVLDLGKCQATFSLPKFPPEFPSDIILFSCSSLLSGVWLSCPCFFQQAYLLAPSWVCVYCISESSNSCTGFSAKPYCTDNILHCFFSGSIAPGRAKSSCFRSTAN